MNPAKILALALLLQTLACHGFNVNVLSWHRHGHAIQGQQLEQEEEVSKVVQ